MNTDLNALFSAMNRGDVSAITEQLFPRTAVSSAIPARSNPGTVQASLQQKGFPTGDAGTAGVVTFNCERCRDTKLVTLYRTYMGDADDQPCPECE